MGTAGVALGVAAECGARCGDDDADDLADCLSAVSLAQGESEHGDVIAGVRPRVGLGDDVRTFEVMPPARVLPGLTCGGHLRSVDIAQMLGHSPHDEDSVLVSPAKINATMTRTTPTEM